MLSNLLLLFCVFLSGGSSQEVGNRKQLVKQFASNTLPECPYSYKDTNDFCYILSEKSTFPPKCPFPNLLPFDFYKNIVEKEKISPIWMPVQRNLTNGLGFLQWVEPSSRYKTIFEDFFIYEGGIKGKDCLLYHNSSYTVAVSCQEEYQGVCAYKKIKFWRNPLCGDLEKCIQSTLSTKSKCVCVETRQNITSPKAEFLEPYQNHVFEMLTNDTCSIGLERGPNETYVWSKSRKVLSYSFWSPKQLFNNSYTHAAQTPNGWVLTEESLPCSLTEKETIKVVPSLNLTLVNASFILNVSSPSGLYQLDVNRTVYCLTDADSSSLLYRFSNLIFVIGTDSYSVYQFLPFADNSGCYWCEGFSYYNVEAITSNVIFYKSNNMPSERSSSVYPLSYSEGVNPLSPEIFELLDKNFVSSPCKYQIIKITDLDEEHLQVIIKIILNCMAKKYELYNDNSLTMCPTTTAYNPTPMLTTGTSEEQFCESETSDKLTWPTTKAGEYSTSYEYCFTLDGYPLKRLCDVDECTGKPFWSHPNETCKIPSNSSVTGNLLTLDNDMPILDQICQISKKYYHFNALDIYIAAEQFFRGYMNDSGLIVCSINNILNIDRNILAESQMKMHATDKWLLKIQILQETDTDNFVAQENFGYLKAEYIDACGITVQEVRNDRIPHKYDQTLDDILKIEHLLSAIWVQLIFVQCVVTYTMHFNDGFFPDGNKTVRGIFGGFFTNCDEPLDAFRVIYRFDETVFSKKVKCVYWNFDEKTTGSWVPDGQFEISDGFFICSFWRTGYFGLEFTPAEDLTDALMDILISDANSTEIISRLLQESYRYEIFSALDLFLVGNILKKVSTSEDTNLNSLSQIVTNLQKIKRSVLSESQRNTNSTDSILYYLDVIIQNRRYEKDFVWKTEGFATLIFNVKNFSGFFLFNNDEIHILGNSWNNSIPYTLKNLTSALLLSQKLKDQMKDDSKIIVNIFFNDTLFNENNKNLTYNKVSKIFDLILPEIDGNYSGPISIYHKLESKVANFCSYWFYDRPRKIDGLWRSESKSTKFSSLMQCDFWHTTHFALLILDEDKHEDEEVLEWFTNITCSLSVLGFCGIFLTALLFKSWRLKTGNKILLNFVLSGIFQIVNFYISSNIEKHGIFCIFTGVALHYSVLAQFFWMLNIAYLQFKRFVVVLGPYPQHILLKTCLFAWGLPLIPVICILSTDAGSYATGSSGLCYPSDYGLYIGVWMPIAFVVLINSGIFICVIRAVLSKKTHCISFGGDEFIYQWRLVFFLFFILGLGWIFGFLTELDGGDVFVYLFCILGTLQGFIMFLFFIVLNKNVRDLYQQLRDQKCSK